MKSTITKTLLTLTILAGGATLATAQDVSLGTMTNGFNSAAMLNLSQVVYAIGVGNTATQTILGVNFDGDGVGLGNNTTAFIDPTGLGYSMINAKSYSQNAPSMTGPDAASLDLLLQANRYGNNGGADSFTLPVTSGTYYTLQLLIWENFASGPGPSGRPETMQIDTGSGLQQAFSISDTITNLAGPVADNAFLWSYSFVPTTNEVTIAFGPGNQILNAAILTIPEPSAWSLTALGLLLSVALAARRRSGRC